MVKKMKRLGLTVRQFQDFTPTPGTLSTAMYLSELHRDRDIAIEVARKQAARNRQRTIIERGFFRKETPPGKHESKPRLSARKKRRH